MCRVTETARVFDFYLFGGYLDFPELYKLYILRKLQPYFDVLYTDEEVFAIATLNVHNKVTRVFEVSTSTLSSSLVSPREVFKRAMLQNAAAVVLAHNHSSGNVEFSSDDIEITKKLLKSCKILGVKIVDHIVIGSKNNFVSMKERGVI